MNIMQIKSLLNNEDGSVIIMALIFMVLLTIIGMSATSTSTIEVQIAGNSARAKQTLYLAEAAAMEAVQRLEEGSVADITSPYENPYEWLNPDLGELTNPITHGTLVSRTSTVTEAVTGGNPTFAAVFRGVTGSTSLGMTSPSQLYTFDHCCPVNFFEKQVNYMNLN